VSLIKGKVEAIFSDCRIILLELRRPIGRSVTGSGPVELSAISCPLVGNVDDLQDFLSVIADFHWLSFADNEISDAPQFR
jgi:hypothetical protein